MRRPFCLLILAAGLLLGTASVANAFPPNYRPNHRPVPVVTPGPRTISRAYVAPQAYSLSPFRYSYYGVGYRSPYSGLTNLGAVYPFLYSWAGAGGGFGYNPFGGYGGFVYNPALGWYGGFGYSPGFFYNVNDPSGGNLYRELRFPDGIYEHINEFYQEKAEAESGKK